VVITFILVTKGYVFCSLNFPKILFMRRFTLVGGQAPVTDGRQNRRKQMNERCHERLGILVDGMESSIRKAQLMGITEWMKKEAADMQENSTKAAVQQQQQIGWHRSICRLFGNEWARLQEQHQPKQMGDSWQASVCSFMVQKVHEFWTVHNSMMYNHDQKDKIAQEESEIIS
jgi:hypothetical protein